MKIKIKEDKVVEYLKIEDKTEKVKAKGPVDLHYTFD